MQGEPEVVTMPSCANSAILAEDRSSWTCGVCGRTYTSLGSLRNSTCRSLEDAQEGPQAPPGATIATEDGPTPVGRVERTPDGQYVVLNLTPDELVGLANRVVDLLADSDLAQDNNVQLNIAMLMLATVHLRAFGVPAPEVMQLVTIAWNGNETGMFALFGPGGIHSSPV